MRIYLAYKYRNNKNKEDLKSQLFNLSDQINQKGHTAFILGRDIQDWGNHKLSTNKTLKTMFKEVKKSDIVICLINSRCFSPGLTFELFCAKMLGKKVVMVSEDTKNIGIERIFASKIMAIANMDMTII
jgi:hypothetical protein